MPRRRLNKRVSKHQNPPIKRLLLPEKTKNNCIENPEYFCPPPVPGYTGGYWYGGEDITGVIHKPECCREIGLI